MNTRTTLLAAAIIAPLLLAGCNKVPDLARQVSSAAPQANQLAIDGQTNGEITSSSPVNYNDGSRHQLYSMKLEANQAVELKLSGALPGRLAVFNDKVFVASIGGSVSDGEHFHGPAMSSSPLSLAFRAPAAGSYTIAVSSNSADAYGPFQLTSKAVVPYAGGPLAVGGEAIDWLVSAKQDYTLAIDKAGLYDITLESAAFDTVLKLTGKGVDQENDDYGNGTHSRLQLYLEPGQYTAQARALDETSRGAFKLTLQPSSLPEGTVVRDGTALPHNTQVSALMDSSARRSFTLQLATHSKVVIDARSNDVDTVLELSGQGVNSEDDDGGNGTNSRLELNLAPGSYTVVVRSLAGNPGNVTVQASVSDL